MPSDILSTSSWWSFCHRLHRLVREIRRSTRNFGKTVLLYWSASTFPVNPIQWIVISPFTQEPDHLPRCQVVPLSRTRGLLLRASLGKVFEMKTFMIVRTFWIKTFDGQWYRVHTIDRSTVRGSSLEVQNLELYSSTGKRAIWFYWILLDSIGPYWISKAQVKS